MFNTKIAVVLRDDLQTWQALNVTAFLIGGLVGRTPEIIGEPYIDRDGNRYNPLIVQPTIVLSGDAQTLSKIQHRCLDRNIDISAYVEEMFSTGNDTDNRAVFAQFSPADARLVGIALREERKVVDKVTKGAKMHR